MKGCEIMTINDTNAIIYKYHDKVTADILIKWANKLTKEQGLTFDQAMIITLLEIHKKGG